MLTFYIVVMCLGTLHVGWAIFGNTQTALILITKFGWDKEETKLWNSLIGNAGLLGNMIGSVFGGQIINKGRRFSTFIMNILILVGVAISLFQTIPTIFIGRFIQGCAAGVMQMCGIKSIFESVPGRLLGVYGSFTNIFLNSGGLICVILGAISLPANPD